jgi:hypothetical protein
MALFQGCQTSAKSQSADIFNVKYAVWSMIHLDMQMRCHVMNMGPFISTIGVDESALKRHIYGPEMSREQEIASKVETMI